MPKINDVIFSYSREQAILDGTLVDLTETAKEAGFKVPMACTSGVWHLLQWDEHDTPGLGQSTEGRVWDALTMARMAAARAQVDRVFFPVLLVPKGGEGDAQEVRLWLHIGPGDQGEPVCTLMLPSED